MASVNSIAQQLSSLDINTGKSAQSQESTRSDKSKQPAQPNVAKLLSKYGAPNPFSAPTASSSTKPTKPSALRHPTAPAQTTTEPTIDIGRYDGGFELDEEKKVEKVSGEAAEDLALDSSAAR